MQLEIVKEFAHGVKMVSGKTTASVYLSPVTGMVNVCCHNAANRAWRGTGKHFANFADAARAYKSDAMKSIIAAAQEHIAAAAASALISRASGK